MTLDEMCMMAARYSDRYDEFEKTLDGGDSQDPEDWYEDDTISASSAMQSTRRTGRYRACRHSRTSIRACRWAKMALLTFLRLRQPCIR